MLPRAPVVLPRAPAEALVDDPRTACFAAGANRGPWSDRELCRRVAKALRAILNATADGAGARLDIVD